MSTIEEEGSLRRAVATAEPVDAKPVTLSAAAIESTAPETLRELRAELSAEGYVPAGLRVQADFEGADSLSVQREADRLRTFLRAATHLGAGRLVVEPTGVDAPEKVQPALEALCERAEREGVDVVVEGGITPGCDGRASDAAR